MLERADPRDPATLVICERLRAHGESRGALADHDPLTGLLSRRRFELDAERELGRAARYGGGAMLILGLDDFSHINDEFGHRAGDALLREAGALITERVRDIDLCGRLGSDQFGVLLTEVTPERARQVGDDILAIIHDHRFKLESRSVAVRVSGGVVGLDTEPADVSEAMSWAEVAMRRAKAMGGGRIFGFEGGLRADVDATRSWSERIRAALDDNDFVPHFQPILELSTDTVATWELLIRMRGERGELILPDAFLPTAERYGLIHELDRWVVRNAIAAMKAHADDRDMTLEINLSGKSIGNPELLETIRDEIEQAHVDPQRIIFEVTETAAIGNLEEASRFGQQLLDLGCGFALDDFGTGLRLLLLPEATAAHPPEDRRRLHPRARLLGRRPARRAGDRRDRPRNGTADDRRIRRGRLDAPTAARVRRRLLPGLRDRHARGADPPGATPGSRLGRPPGSRVQVGTPSIPSSARLTSRPPP